MSTTSAIALVYLASAATSAAAGVVAYRRREAPGGRPLAAMLFAASLWALCDVFEVNAPTAEGRLFVSQVQYLGVVSAAPFFLHTAIEISGMRRWLTPVTYTAIWGIPLVSLVAAWTNPWHHWLWTGITMPEGTLPFAVYHYGWWFWVLTAQHYLVTAVGTALLVYTLRRIGHHFRVPIGAVVAAIVVAWVGNAAYVFKLGPWPGLNWLTLSLGVSGGLLTWAVVREGLLDLLPRAREALLDTITDGVVVLDRLHRIGFANPSARRLLNLERDAARLPPLLRLESRYEQSVPWFGEVSVPSLAGTRWLDIRVDAVHDRWGELAGRLMLVRDVTVQKELERERERLIGELQEALTTVRQLEELMPICASCRKVRDDRGYWGQIEEYLASRTSMQFTHGICPDCMSKLYGPLVDDAPPDPADPAPPGGSGR
ncbi:MAG: histidine kinase N-terminal 7TM domain-containing protein [Vicinamibacterales bacterium]